MRRLRSGAMAVVAVAALALPAVPAGAVITTTLLSLSANRLTLRVGSALGTIDIVDFAVTGTGIQPNNAPVVSANTVSIVMTAEKSLLLGLGLNSARLTVDSSAGMTCVAASGCGTVTIPFSTVTWQTQNPDASGLDIRSGGFTGDSGQQIALFGLPVLTNLSSSTVMSNLLSFSYANSTLYPAGTYRGRVVFTATMF